METRFQGTLIFLAILMPLSASDDIGKYFTWSPQSIVAPPGDRVTFRCETNVPSEQVRWKLNGRFLNPAKESDIRVSGSNLYVKVSHNAERYVLQTGDYQCVVEFGAEALTSIPAKLEIAKMDAFAGPHINQTLEVVEGSTVAIPCNPPYSKPPALVQFFKDGKPLEPDSQTSVVTEQGVLLMWNLSTSERGVYGCAVINHITSETQFSNSFTTVQVVSSYAVSRQPPKFLLKPNTVNTVSRGGNVSLDCVATGNPPPQISWRKFRSYSGNLKPQHGSLNLYNVGLDEEGEYLCEAHNGVGRALTALSTVVINSMPNITNGPSSQVVEEDADAFLECLVQGLPKPRVSWVFNGISVSNDGNVIQKDNGLKITKVEKKHAGLWQCFAANPVGVVSSPAELKVRPQQRTILAPGGTAFFEKPKTSAKPPIIRSEGTSYRHKKFRRRKHKRRKHKGQEMTPPSKPIMNRVSDTSVMVQWEVPDNSGYPIQFFKVQYKETGKGGSRWMTIDDDIPPHIHSFEVKDLKVGHKYRFRIAAVYSNNDNKVGPNSDKFLLTKEVTMVRPTHTPVITSALPINDSAIMLQWQTIKPEGVDIDGYFIYYRESTSAYEYQKVTVLGADMNSVAIGHLKPAVSYDIKVQSFNTAGASELSAIVPAKTAGHVKENIEEDTISHIPEEEELPKSNNNLYILLGCLGIGFWICLCIGCALCYKCKQKRAEEEVKYACDLPLQVETKNHVNSAHLNGHIHNSLNGYIPTITSQLDEKETSFVERYNNNRPISPLNLNSSNCDLSSLKTMTLERSCSTFADPEMKIINTNRVGVNSLGRKRHKNSNNSNHSNSNRVGSLKRIPYTSCSSDDLDSEETRSSRIFPKEHYKVPRKHSRKRAHAQEQNTAH